MNRQLDIRKGWHGNLDGQRSMNTNGNEDVVFAFAAKGVWSGG